MLVLRLCTGPGPAAPMRWHARGGRTHKSRRRGETTIVDSSPRVHFDEKLGRRPRADRDRGAVLAAEFHGIGYRVTRLDFDRLTGLEVVLLNEAQKRRILIRDARDLERCPHRAR